MNKFGYTVFLHKSSQPSSQGFGYKPEQEQEVRERAALWNSWTAETCPHGSILDGAKCNLCGNKYEVTIEP